MPRPAPALALAGLGLGAALLLSPLGLEAQEPGVAPADTARATVRVSATGSAEISPDRAVVVLAVETEADSAAAAAAANAERMARVIAALEELGIAADAIETSGYRLHPEYAHPRRGEEGEEPRIAGYRAVNEVRVTVDSLPRTGEVIDAAVGAGANRVTNISFEASEAVGRPARLEALRSAVERARERAEAIAGAAGLRLGALLEVTAGEGAAPPPVPMFEAARMDVQTPVRPGELTVTESVTAAWRLERP